MGLFSGRAKKATSQERDRLAVDEYDEKTEVKAATAGKKVTKKSKRGKKSDGKRPGEDSSLRRRQRNHTEEDETIGAQLALEDQFYLEVPNKRRPAAILRKPGELFSRRKKHKMEHPQAIEEASTVSSITFASMQLVQPSTQIQRDLPPGGTSGCCGACTPSDESTAGDAGGKGRRAPKQLTFFNWIFSCGPSEEWIPANGAKSQRHGSTSQTVETTPAYHRRKNPENALFDQLEDDENADFMKDNTALALDEDTLDTKNSMWQRFKMRRNRSVPRLRSLRKKKRSQPAIEN